jgi:hypothetical protein
MSMQQTQKQLLSPLNSSRGLCVSGIAAELPPAI